MFPVKKRTERFPSGEKTSARIEQGDNNSQNDDNHVAIGIKRLQPDKHEIVIISSGEDSNDSIVSPRKYVIQDFDVAKFDIGDGNYGIGGVIEQAGKLEKNESKQANETLDAAETSMNSEKPLENSHQNGVIHKIRFEHFLTHSDLSLSPGKNLNVFCGSSIIKGIAIGLGGDPKILSKTHELHQYIQIGEETATITLTLYHDNGYITFCHEFDRKNESKFKIDGEDVSKEAYSEKAHNLNIHVDNLCQILPQLLLRDCISQYPQGLFRRTQMSMSQNNMLEKYEELGDLHDQQAKNKKKLSENEHVLQEQKIFIELVQPKVDEIRRQNALKERLNGEQLLDDQRILKEYNGKLIN